MIEVGDTDSQSPASGAEEHPKCARSALGIAVPWYDCSVSRKLRLTAVYMKVPESYVAFVEGLPGANTQGETLEEARANLEEAVTMVLDANRDMSEQSLAL